MRDLLGGKGAGLAEMTSAGLPVPPGFTISTEVCALFESGGGNVPQAVERENGDPAPTTRDPHRVDPGFS